MVSPTEASGSTAAPRRQWAFRSLAGWASIAVSAFAGLVLFLNLIGCSLYLYVNIGSKDLILGGSIGTFHAAVASHTDMNEMAVDPTIASLGSIPGYWHTDLLELGPIHTFAESPGDSFQPLRFDFIKDDEYMAVEFPLLIMAAAFATIGVVLLKRRNAPGFVLTSDRQQPLALPTNPRTDWLSENYEFDRTSVDQDRKSNR